MNPSNHAPACSTPLDVEVLGTLDEVWNALATGSGGRPQRLAVPVSTNPLDPQSKEYL